MASTRSSTQTPRARARRRGRISRGASRAGIRRPSFAMPIWSVAASRRSRRRGSRRPASFPQRSCSAHRPARALGRAPAYTVIADSSGEVRAPAFSSWFERLMHAWRLQTPRLLLTEPPTPRPKVLFHRDVRERVAALAPFLTIGPKLQAMALGDSLYWIAELFSTSGEYPLSEPLLFAGEERHYV